MTTDIRAALDAAEQHATAEVWADHPLAIILGALIRQTRAALAQPEGEGLSLAEVDELCAEFGFHLDDDQGEGLEVLQEMITAALARWGRPTAPPAPRPEGDWFAVAVVAQDMRSRGLAEQACGEELLKLANSNRSQPARPATPPAPEVGEVEASWGHGFDLKRLADRLDELANYVTQGPDCIRRNFTMRVPAEPYHDADLVIGTAARLLRDGRAATLLQQQAAPAPVVVPVAVAERPWEREGWCDVEGRCWGWDGNDWIPTYPLRLPVEIYARIYSLSLPAHAIPLPQCIAWDR
jgi:hypothetical protein